jgi:hypothetical protein
VTSAPLADIQDHLINVRCLGIADVGLGSSRLPVLS